MQDDHLNATASIASISGALLGGLVALLGTVVGPEVWFGGSTHLLQLAIGALAVVVSFVVAVALPDARVLVRLGTATLISIAVYAVVVFGVYLVRTEAGRAAEREAQSWRTVGELDFSEEEQGEVYDTEFGRWQRQWEDGRLIMNLSTTRDFTAQIGTSSDPPTLTDFYVRADVELLEGPQNSYCGILFGWTGNESWVAFKLGADSFQITRNRGTLPHERIADPESPVTVVRPGEINELAILSQGGVISFFINDQRVEQRELLDPPSGQIWLAAQAARTSSALRCAFDNVLVKTP